MSLCPSLCVATLMYVSPPGMLKLSHIRDFVCAIPSTCILFPQNFTWLLFSHHSGLSWKVPSSEKPSLTTTQQSQLLHCLLSNPLFCFLHSDYLCLQSSYSLVPPDYMLQEGRDHVCLVSCLVSGIVRNIWEGLSKYL